MRVRFYIADSWEGENLRTGSSCMEKPKQNAKNQKLDRSEQEFYKRNKHLVDFKRTYTERDEDVISKWT